MSYAHKGSRLILSGNPFILPFTATYFDFNYDVSGIEYGNLIEPVGTPVFTQRGDGRFGGGVAIEDATANLISNTDFTSWHTFSNSVVTVTPNYIDPFGGTRATRIQTSGGGSTLKYYGDIGGGVSGSSYSASIWLKNNSTTPIVLNNQIDGLHNTITKDMGWVCNTSTGVANGASDIQIRFESQNITDMLDFFAFQPQIEQKAFSTSFVSGNRSIGNLEYIANINPPNGTISFWYKPEYDSSVVTTQGNSPVLFQAGSYYGNSSITIWNYMNKYTLYVKGPTSSGWSVGGLQAGTFTKGVWTMISITWNGTSWIMYKDGIQVASSTANEVLGPMNGYPIYIGTNGNSNQTCANGIFSDFIIDSITYSSDDILNMYMSNRPLFNPYDKRTYAL